MVNKAEAQWVHENQGRGNGTNRSTVDGRTTKDLHSPLEILPERYTAISDEGQHPLRQSVRDFETGVILSYKACDSSKFLVGP
jgi:hypothetical protein